jgi:hypothetical protein
MTFLNPLLLFGLAAAAIPILLHLFNLRKLRTIEFSTLTFIKELQKTRIRRLKLRQVLLLVLRTLLVILLALAFARPTLKGSLAGTIGSHAKTTAVLLFDDSFTMTVNDEQGVLLKQAKRAAGMIVDLLNQGDEVFLVRLSEIHPGLPEDQQAATRDLALLRKEIEAVRPSYVHTPIEDALRYAAKLLSKSTNFNKEVYLFSDFKSGSFDLPTASSAQEKLFPREVHFFFVPFGRRPIQNLGIESVSIPSSIFERSRPLTVEARIGNYSTGAVQDHVVSVFLNGTRVTQRGVDILSGASADVEFSVVPNTFGYISGFVELEDDDFEYDNHRYFVIDVPEHIRVLIIGKPAEMRYVSLALATRQSSTGSSFDLQEVSPNQLSSAQVDGADVVVLTNSQDLSSLQVNELSSFLASGGGLVVFPEPHVQPAVFNKVVAAPLRLPTISGIDGRVSQGASFVEFEKIDLRHPVFQGMFEEPGVSPQAQRTAAAATQRSVESPRVSMSVRYALTPQSDPIITLSNGAPFLLEQQVGTGRAFLYCVAADLQWSDFPLKGLFVPLLHRSISYLDQEREQPNETLAGNEILLKSRVRAGVPWTVQDPNKGEVVVTPDSSGSLQVARFSETDGVGIYTAAAGKQTIEMFAVNLDPRESNTRKAPAAVIEGMLHRLGIDPASVKEVREPQDLQRTILESRFGVELWKYMLLAALIVALAEMIVARTSKQETLAP